MPKTYVEYPELDEPIVLGNSSVISSSEELFGIIEDLEASESWTPQQFQTYNYLKSDPEVQAWIKSIGSTSTGEKRWQEFQNISPDNGSNTGQYSLEYLNANDDTRNLQVISENYTDSEIASWLKNNGIELTPEEMEAYPRVAALMPPERPLAAAKPETGVNPQLTATEPPKENTFASIVTGETSKLDGYTCTPKTYTINVRHGKKQEMTGVEVKDSAGHVIGFAHNAAELEGLVYSTPPESLPKSTFASIVAGETTELYGYTCTPETYTVNVGHGKKQEMTGVRIKDSAGHVIGFAHNAAEIGTIIKTGTKSNIESDVTVIMRGLEDQVQDVYCNGTLSEKLAMGETGVSQTYTLPNGQIVKVTAKPISTAIYDNYGDCEYTVETLKPAISLEAPIEISTFTSNMKNGEVRKNGELEFHCNSKGNISVYVGPRFIGSYTPDSEGNLVSSDISKIMDEIYQPESSTTSLSEKGVKSFLTQDIYINPQTASETSTAIPKLNIEGLEATASSVPIVTNDVLLQMMNLENMEDSSMEYNGIKISYKNGKYIVNGVKCSTPIDAAIQLQHELNEQATSERKLMALDKSTAEKYGVVFNEDGTITVNGEKFKSAADAQKYLESLGLKLDQAFNMDIVENDDNTPWTNEARLETLKEEAIKKLRNTFKCPEEQWGDFHFDIEELKSALKLSIDLDTYISAAGVSLEECRANGTDWLNIPTDNSTADWEITGVSMPSYVEPMTLPADGLITGDNGKGFIDIRKNVDLINDSIALYINCVRILDEEVDAEFVGIFSDILNNKLGIAIGDNDTLKVQEYINSYAIGKIIEKYLHGDIKIVGTNPELKDKVIDLMNDITKEYSANMSTSEKWWNGVGVVALTIPCAVISVGEKIVDGALEFSAVAYYGIASLSDFIFEGKNLRDSAVAYGQTINGIVAQEYARDGYLTSAYSSGLIDVEGEAHARCAGLIESAIFYGLKAATGSSSFLYVSANTLKKIGSNTQKNLAEWENLDLSTDAMRQLSLVDVFCQTFNAATAAPLKKGVIQAPEGQELSAFSKGLNSLLATTIKSGTGFGQDAFNAYADLTYGGLNGYLTLNSENTFDSLVTEFATGLGDTIVGEAFGYGWNQAYSGKTDTAHILGAVTGSKQLETSWRTFAEASGDQYFNTDWYKAFLKLISPSTYIK